MQDFKGWFLISSNKWINMNYRICHRSAFPPPKNFFYWRYSRLLENRWSGSNPVIYPNRIKVVLFSVFLQTNVMFFEHRSRGVHTDLLVCSELLPIGKLVTWTVDFALPSHGVTSAVWNTRDSRGSFRKPKFTLNPSAVPAPSLVRILMTSVGLALDDSNALVMNSRAETSSNTYVDRRQNCISVLTLNTTWISDCLHRFGARKIQKFNFVSKKYRVFTV